MTGTLTAERSNLAAVMWSAGYTAYTIIPDRYVPPIVGLTPGNPYLTTEDSDPFRHFTVRYDATVILRPGKTEEVMNQLDDAIEKLGTALLNEGYGITDVGTPYPLEHGTATFLAVALTVTTTVQL